MVISLAGLWMVENQALRSMALGAMIVVAVAILVAITLLPVLIRLLGHRVEAGGVVWAAVRACSAVPGAGAAGRARPTPTATSSGSAGPRG